MNFKSLCQPCIIIIRNWLVALGNTNVTITIALIEQGILLHELYEVEPGFNENNLPHERRVLVRLCEIANLVPVVFSIERQQSTKKEGEVLMNRDYSHDVCYRVL